MYEKFSAFVLTIFALSIPQLSLSQERMLRLEGSYLVRNLEKEGVWDVVISQSEVAYRCRECDPEVDVGIRVLPLESNEALTNANALFLQDRRVYCSQLVARREGRCIRTKPYRWNSRLGGYLTEQEVGEKREIRLVYFSNDYEFGPELIVGLVTAEAGTSVPEGTISMLSAHMAKLTLLW